LNLPHTFCLGESGTYYKFKFKLPNDISGHVLLQWYYITGNSCTAQGYDQYPFPTGWAPTASTCPHIPEDGNGVPEQFWNCGEVYITGNDGPSVTPAPVPSAPSPTTASPVASPVAAPTPTTASPVASPVTTPGPPTNPSDKTIVGYYASWQQYDRGGIGKPENMDFTKVDRVNFAFFQPDANGNIFGTDSWGDPLALFGPQNWMGTTHCSWDGPNQKTCNKHQYEKGLISLVHAAGGEIYPSIGGWTLSDQFPAVAASATARTNFANQCVELIKDYDFDGIDIDWEYPGYSDHSGTPQDKLNFNLLLDEMRLKLDELGSVTGTYYGLTAALPCGPSHIDNMDIPHVANVLDELLLMTYDLNGPWNSVTGVNAPLYYQGFGDMNLSVDSCVQIWKDGGAPPSKISLGLAFYGRSFAYASGLNTPHSGSDENNWSADDGLPQYFSIVEKLPAMTSVRHDVSKTPYAFFNNGNGFVSYDDERSICEKTEYAIDNGLNGFLIWELSSDLMPDLSTPLLDMVNSKLSNPNLNCASGEPETSAPTPSQTWNPTAANTQSPTVADTQSPTVANTQSPTAADTQSPTVANTQSPTAADTQSPTVADTQSPTVANTQSPTAADTQSPTAANTQLPTVANTQSPTVADTQSPTAANTQAPTAANTQAPTATDTQSPTAANTQAPTVANTSSPTKAPSPSSGPACPSGYTGIIASDTCSQYQHCVGGVSYGDFMPCASGTLFDENLQNCNYYYSVWCNGNPPEGVPLCPNGYTGLMAVDECSGYRHCSNGVVISQKVSCSAGTLYDESIKNCNWAWAFTCGSGRKRGLRGSVDE
jgi:chitinase